MAVYSQNAMVGTAIALPILGIIAVALRFFVRLRMRRTFIGADDWLVLLAVVFVCGQAVIQILMVEIGTGGQDDTPPSAFDKTRVAEQQKLVHAVEVIEKVTYVSIKLSFLFLYRRIFGTNITFRRIADALSALIVVWGLIFLFIDLFICATDADSNTTCAAQTTLLLWFGITEVLGDIMILSLPFPMLRKLQINKRDRIGLTAIFAIGAISTIAGLVRLGYVAKAYYQYFHPNVFNDSASAPGFWTTAEVAIGVLAACLPPLGPILRLAPSPHKVYSSIRHGLSSWSRHHGRFSLSGQGTGSGGSSRNNKKGVSDGKSDGDRTAVVKEKYRIPSSVIPPPYTGSSEETLRDTESQATWYKSRLDGEEEREGEWPLRTRQDAEATWLKSTNAEESDMDLANPRTTARGRYETV